MISKQIPDFCLKAYFNGEIVDIKLNDYKKKRIILIFYPYDFSSVCPTEINELSEIKKDIEAFNSVVLFISCDSIDSHKTWAKMEKKDGGIKGVAWPLVSDYTKILSEHFDLVQEDGSCMRATIIIEPSLKVSYVNINCNVVGRSTDELLRILKALKFVEENPGEVCLVNWNKKG